MARITISVRPSVRDRLKTFGCVGMSHEHTLTSLMDRVQRDSFVEELPQQCLPTPREDYAALEVL